MGKAMSSALSRERPRRSPHWCRSDQRSLPCWTRWRGKDIECWRSPAGAAQQLTLMGLIALSDPPRPDSKALLAELRSMGVHTVMVTGDAAPTAATVAAAIGLEGPVCPPGAIPDRVKPEDFAVYAGVFPEDKFRLVKAFQRDGHTVGMCGDGVNDAPALRQAQMGIAVSTATDVAKSAASMVLMEPGLQGHCHGDQGGSIRFPAHSHLHPQCTREEIRVRAVFRRRSGDDGSLDTDAHADGFAVDHGGFSHDVADHRPGDTLADRPIVGAFDPSPSPPQSSRLFVLTIYRRRGRGRKIRPGFSLLQDCARSLSSRSCSPVKRPSMLSASAVICGIPDLGSGSCCLLYWILVSQLPWRSPAPSWHP